MAGKRIWRDMRNPCPVPDTCEDSRDYAGRRPDNARVEERPGFETREAMRRSGMPRIIPTPVPRPFLERGTAPEHSPFILELKRGRVYGPGIIITDDNVLLRDVSLEWQLRFTDGKLDHSLRYGGRLPEVKRMAGTCLVLESLGSGNHYHYLFDSISRAAVAGDLITATDWIYISADQPMQRQICERAGIPVERVIQPDDAKHLQFDSLMVPSIPGCTFGTVGWLRTTFADEAALGAKRRIYVSRRDTTGRRLLNEDEVSGYLGKLGFETVVLGGLPFREQVEIFASAEMVVGVHGAGMTNLAFCSPGTRILELLPAWYPNPIYCQLCDAAGLVYVGCLSEGERSSAERDGRMDFRVSMENVQDGLALLGIP